LNGLKDCVSRGGIVVVAKQVLLLLLLMMMMMMTIFIAKGHGVAKNLRWRDTVLVTFLRVTPFQTTTSPTFLFNGKFFTT